ncbi:3-keto-disaccharide hydrolase [Zavarzinella formosa]|uniref:3-keto-disaccharide hydrolase n=1 Tax=Zavarzinella formosa TaxID=360055 RepID=UPI0002DD77AF|nr:DUF1080 domain-containing protein [Zavarzinella formosa]
MRTVILTALIGLIASLVFSFPAKSEGEPVGVPLIRKQMKEWSRSGSGKNPWQLTTADTLVCEAAKESYSFEELFGDGTFHVEWRFTPTASNAKKAVAASVTVRGNGEQNCKIALGTDCGKMTTSIVASNDHLKAFETIPAGVKPKAIGDWNSMTIKLEGRSAAVIINGVTVASVVNAPATGTFSVNAEGDPVEFRNIRWQAAR